MKFTAHTALTGLTIACTSQQADIYTSSLPLLLVAPAPQPLHSILSPSSAPTVAVLAILLSSLLLVGGLVLLLKLQRRKRDPLGCSPSPSPTWPLGAGLAPGLTSTPSADRSCPSLPLDGRFVSFSPLDMYGGGDSLLEAGDALYPVARAADATVF